MKESMRIGKPMKLKARPIGRDVNQQLLRQMQNRVAETCVGPSALRNQGSPGVIGRTRKRLKRIDLAGFSVRSKRAFASRLDRETIRLKKALPRNAQNWGTARKALNLFLRDALYHRVLCDSYGLARLERWLEVPLDRYVAKAIRRELPSAGLPRWLGIKHLKPEVSMVYQAAAAEIATIRRTARVHLDLVWWRP